MEMRAPLRRRRLPWCSRWPSCVELRVMLRVVLVFAAAACARSEPFASPSIRHRPCMRQRDRTGISASRRPVLIATRREAAASSKQSGMAVAGGLAGALSGDGPFTIFAPTNAAFAKLPEGTIATLLKPENKGKLASILKYHVVAGKVMAADVKAGKVKTLNGAKAKIAIKDGKVTIDKANIVKTDIVGTNGVIHVIDSVILPAAK